MTKIITEGGKVGFYEVDFSSLQICPLCGPVATEWLGQDSGPDCLTLDSSSDGH